MDESEGIEHIMRKFPQLKESSFERLGEGGYATCFCVDDRMTLKIYSEKGLGHLNAQFLPDEYKPRREDLRPELDNLLERVPSLSQVPRPVPEYCKDNVLAFRYIPGMNLEAYISWMDEAEIQPETQIGLCIKIAKRVAQIQRADYIHGDLKPENIILKNTYFDEDTSRFFDEQKDTTYFTPQPWLIDWDHAQNSTRRGGIFSCGDSTSGTIQYLPTEYLSFGTYDRKSETETLGRIIYEVICGKPLCEEPGDLNGMEILSYGDSLLTTFRKLPEWEPLVPLPKDVETEIRNLIKRCLLPSYHRPWAADVKKELQRFGSTVTVQ